ncbi:MAG: hypothetical protein V5B40_15540 [Candidatus Accumulibacter meliphilus]|jgi:hypothetical protein|uniref:hypothetical protein n=1 Tax=Candidatus Accumulibacter meliphilus TaxID=2211374 RepID=UPI002FC2A713
MEFRIADTFTDSLARLTGDEQKGCENDGVRLADQPDQPRHGFPQTGAGEGR